MFIPRRTRTPMGERKQVIRDDPEDPPAMFIILASAIVSAVIEYIYARADDAMDDVIAYHTERVKRLLRWIVRRYGPESADAIIATVIIFPRKSGDNLIPGLGSVIHTLLVESLMEMYKT